MGHIEFFGNKIADFCKTARKNGNMHRDGTTSVKHRRMIVTCNINENWT